MSYESKNLSVMSYANGFTLWNYQSADAMSEIKDETYFNDAASIIRKGDMILTIANIKATPEPAVLCVSDVSNGTVAVVDINSAA